MKKSKITIIVLIIIVVLEFICIIYLNITNPSWHNVTISIKEGTLSSTGFTLVVNDKNFLTTNFHFGNYYIEKLTYKGWEELVKVTDIDPTCDIYIIYSRIPHLYEIELNWKKELGELEKGKYRIKFKANYDDLELEMPTTLFVEFKI